MKRCTSKRHLMGLLGSSWLLALAFCLLSYGQNASRDNDPHATGYIPPTPEQERQLEETHPRIVKVWPNRLAWVRTNEERKAKGLQPLPEKGIAPNGAEKEFTVGDGPVLSGLPQGFVGLTNLPGSIDNSTLDAFPEIRTQGSLGSCTTFAITYYQLTYMAGRLYVWDNKNVNNDRKFSPKWTYNMINKGVDKGSSPGEAYAVLEQHGAATWTQFPYQTSNTDPKSYREWCLNGETWRSAISYRIYPHFWCTPTTRPPSSGDFDTWLATIKGLLAIGEVLTFPTYISSWQYTSIGDDPGTGEDDAFKGKSIAYWVNGSQGGHMMTIVGYNDSIWTDINKNGVVDPGEKGALRIANSWGPTWMESGFCWLAYDALRGQSAVGPNSGRQPALLGYGVYSINLMPDYTPTLLAKFKLKHAKRDQLCVALAASNGAKWTPGALQFQGGPYAFDGTSVPCEGTFVFDFTDVLRNASDSDLYELHVADSTRRNPAELLGYKLTDMNQGWVSGGLLGSPFVVDNAESTASLTYPSDPESVPVARASAQPASGRAPLTVTFDGRMSSDPGDDIFSYSWNFGDGSTPVQVRAPSTTTTHTYRTAGTYVATLTVTDEGWAESSAQVVVTATGKK
jgi:hypothetical protein